LTKKNTAIFEYLERSRALRTLLCLLDTGDKGLDQLLREIGGSKSTGMSRLDELVQLGLVTKIASPTEKRKMLYRLTSKGREVAEQLKGVLDRGGQ
jgi:DNA-binding HxlR family transcriptional regulator